MQSAGHQKVEKQRNNQKSENLKIVKYFDLALHQPIPLPQYNPQPPKKEEEKEGAITKHIWSTSCPLWAMPFSAPL